MTAMLALVRIFVILGFAMVIRFQVVAARIRTVMMEMTVQRMPAKSVMAHAATKFQQISAA